MSYPTITALKAEARALRAAAPDGPLTHSAALEAIARKHGARDWNTLSALAAKTPNNQPPYVGQFVAGRYLGHEITGRIVAHSLMAEGRRHRITLDLDKPVNVSAFSSFEVTRKRLRATIDEKGETVEKTSDGTPHMKLNL
ncbi:MAG: glyoxalase superfamily protein [Pikeienuella sp.]